MKELIFFFLQWEVITVAASQRIYSSTSKLFLHYSESILFFLGTIFCKNPAAEKPDL